MTTRTPDQIVDLICQKVRTEGAIVPRPYQTIGGMWTVDTWVLGNIVVKVMDEGYTRNIRWRELNVVESHNKPLVYEKGDEAMLRHLAGVLSI